MPATHRNITQATSLATASSDPDELLQAAAAALVRVYEVPRADAWAWTDNGLRHAHTAGAGASTVPTFELQQRLARAGISQTLDFDELRASGAERWAQLAFGVGAKRVCLLSLMADDEPLGMVSVFLPEDFTAVDELQVVATHVSQALLKARLHRSAREASELLTQQNKLLARFAECRDIAALAAAVSQHVQRTLPTAETFIAVLEHKHATFYRATSGETPEGRRVWLATLSALGRLARHDRSFGPVATVPTAKERALLGLPKQGAGDAPLLFASLGTHERRLGALLIATGSADDADIANNLLTVAQPAVSIALDNAILFMRANLRSVRLAAANEIARDLTGAEHSEDLYGRLATGLVERLGYTRATLHDGHSQPTQTAGEPSHDALVEVGLVQRAIVYGKLVTADQDDCTAYAVPLYVKDVLARVLYVEHVNDGISDFDDHDRALLDTVVDQACGTLSVLAAYEDLEQSYLSTIQSLASALEASDQYTHDHAEEVAEWAVEVARQLDLDPAEIKDIELGAIFHDIGKIAIPTHILHKPGRLTDDEFEVMKTHTVMGERIIAPLDFLANVRPMVRHEHERWDGHGYPDGLVGDNIPLGSRIIFVCDAYHAITSDRPYRAAQSHEVARRILIENAGTQFDPAVVHAFLEVLDHKFGTDAESYIDLEPIEQDFDELPLGVRDAVRHQRRALGASEDDQSAAA